MSEIYETDEDLAAQERVARWLEKKWFCRLELQERLCAWDYVMRRALETPVGIVEIKCVDYPSVMFKRQGYFFVDAAKMKRCRAWFAEHKSKGFHLVVRTSDRRLYCKDFFVADAFDPIARKMFAPPGQAHEPKMVDHFAWDSFKRLDQ